MEQIKKAVITIESSEPTKACVMLQQMNDATRVHHIPIRDVAGMLYGGYEVEEEEVYERIGSMPAGYLDMKYCSKKNFMIACLIEPEIRPYHYMVNCERLFLIPFPRCLFLFEVKDGDIRQSKCFAVNNAGSSCVFPFPNVHDGGNICWGGNKKPKISAPCDVEHAINLFFSSGFNTHLYSSTNTNLNMSIENLLRYLEPLTQFPDEILVRENKSMTCQEKVEKFFSQGGNA